VQALFTSRCGESYRLPSPSNSLDFAEVERAQENYIIKYTEGVFEENIRLII